MRGLDKTGRRDPHLRVSRVSARARRSSAAAGSRPAPAPARCPAASVPAAAGPPRRRAGPPRGSWTRTSWGGALPLRRRGTPLSPLPARGPRRKSSSRDHRRHHCHHLQDSRRLISQFHRLSSKLGSDLRTLITNLLLAVVESLAALVQSKHVEPRSVFSSKDAPCYTSVVLPQLPLYI